MARNTLVDFFHDLARASGEFLVYDDGFRTRRYSYAQVGHAARGFAGRVAGAGVRKGDAVVFWSENRPESGLNVTIFEDAIAGVDATPGDSARALIQMREGGAHLMLV